MSACVNPAQLYGSPLSSKVALFNAVANKHLESQATNPFSNGYKAGSLPRPKISKEEYGRPARGSLSEARGFKATQHICREMLELCEIISEQGERLFTEKEKPDDPRIVISFGELFTIYTVINDKLVGLLLRARKHKLLDFEGEVLFQRRDDHVPVILLKPLSEIREMFRVKLEPLQPVEQKSSDEEKEEEDRKSDEQGSQGDEQESQKDEDKQSDEQEHQNDKQEEKNDERVQQNENDVKENDEQVNLNDEQTKQNNEIESQNDHEVKTNDQQVNQNYAEIKPNDEIVNQTDEQLTQNIEEERNSDISNLVV